MSRTEAGNAAVAALGCVCVGNGRNNDAGAVRAGLYAGRTGVAGRTSITLRTSDSLEPAQTHWRGGAEVRWVVLQRSTGDPCFARACSAIGSTGILYEPTLQTITRCAPWRVARADLKRLAEMLLKTSMHSHSLLPTQPRWKLQEYSKPLNIVGLR